MTCNEIKGEPRQRMENMLLLIMDGVGDRPCALLDGKTPLESAFTPNLDHFATVGINGLMDPIAPGIRAGSDTSHLALLGYDPYKTYTGRGPFEAAGIGMEVRPGDVAFRCNFASVDEGMTILDRRAQRIKEGTHELAQALSTIKIPGVEVMIKESVEHRAALVLRGTGLGSDVTDSDPHDEGCKVHMCSGSDEASQRTASVVNEFVRKSFEVLDQHPVNIQRRAQGKLAANILLTRGAGMAPHVPDLKERLGLNAACVAGISLIKGVCSLAGIRILDVPGATGGLDTDLNSKLKVAADALEEYDLVFVNLKLPDLNGHDSDPLGKVDSIQRIDIALGTVREKLLKHCVAITGDHSTPCPVGDHSGDPLPLVLCSSGVRRDGVRHFNEVAAGTGSLSKVLGIDLLGMMMDLTVRSEKFGA